MKGDIPDAALRLVSTLPYRTHLSKEPEANPRWRPGLGHKRPLVIEGVTYSSMAEAARKLGLCRETVRLRYALKVPYKYAVEGR